MTPTDFIATARDLAQANIRGRPRQTNLRRAVSTTYHALFHAIAGCCADTLVGGPNSNRSEGRGSRSIGRWNTDMREGGVLIGILGDSRPKSRTSPTSLFRCNRNGIVPITVLPAGSTRTGCYRRLLRLSTSCAASPGSHSGTDGHSPFMSLCR